MLVCGGSQLFSVFLEGLFAGQAEVTQDEPLCVGLGFEWFIQ
jgi:hypothetical protein